MKQTITKKEYQALACTATVAAQVRGVQASLARTINATLEFYDDEYDWCDVAGPTLVEKFIAHPESLDGLLKELGVVVEETAATVEVGEARA